MRPIAGIVCGLLLGGSSAFAQFSVDRTQVRLAGRAQSAIVKLTSESSRPLRFDVKIFAWDHSETGEERLTPAAEAIVAPGAITLAPGQSQNIRVGSTAPLGARERTYRLIIEELPTPRAQAAGATIAMRMRLSIPVFLRPTNGQAKLELDPPTMSGGVTSIVARNTGTVHLQIDSATFRGVSAGGQTAFEVQHGGVYVLPGKELRIQGPRVTADQCRSSAKIVAGVLVHGDKVTQEAPIAAAACGG